MYQAMTPGIDIYGIEVKPVKSKRELPQELAERLALPEDANCPLIIDDALVNFDAERRKQAMTLLEKIAQERQVILFTCS